ncbi:hypothetical protein ILYODFUR_032419 [Ilyodon furcidens]|uniref:Uncharacterized protein n=1 Tax=Ilyodon furcidens TaxID=33524 RepID=A0ABV0V805_9TELE
MFLRGTNLRESVDAPVTGACTGVEILEPRTLSGAADRSTQLSALRWEFVEEDGEAQIISDVRDSPTCGSLELLQSFLFRPVSSGLQ